MSEPQSESVPDMEEPLEPDLPDPGQTEYRSAEPPSHLKLTRERSD
jgi:hypothetical protein